MASSLDVKHLATGLACALFTAVLVWFGSGLFPAWPLMWFAPLPVLLFALRSQTWWGAALVAALGWWLGNVNVWEFFREALGLPVVLLVIFTSLETLTLVLAVLLFRALARRGRPWSALLAFPSVYVAIEFVNNLTSVHGTFGSLSYTQLDFLPFLQLASITGPWGMSFLLLLFSAAAALGLHLYRSTPLQAWRIVGVGVGIIAGALVFGTVRLALPAQRQLVKVGLVASDPPTSPDVADEGTPTTKLMEEYATRVTALADQGAKVIVLPEKLAVTVDPGTKDTDMLFQSLSDKLGVQIVVGLIRVASPIKYNEARVYMPGVPVQSYDKHHMLPPFESKLTPGTSLLTLHEPTGLWGVAICKDMDFTPLSRQYGLAGTGLMLVPAWDFVGDRWEHGHMAVMRGVEDGFNMVRAAKQGFLTVSDNRGRILAETTSYSVPFTTLLADVPTVHDWTLYQTLGDWFGWANLALLSGIFASLGFKRRRTS